MLITTTLTVLSAVALVAGPSKWKQSDTEVLQALPALPDFSYAGYHRGEDSLPEREPTVSVLDFGATPDDDTDDTQAFKDAIAQSAGGCIAVPAGRFVLSDRLAINQSGTVLKGSGADQTTLFFTKPLEEIESKRTANSGGTPTSGWSWSGGMITLTGPTSKTQSHNVTDTSEQDAATLHLPAGAFEVGDEVVVESRSDDDAVARAVYGDLREKDTDVSRIAVRQVVRITAVDGEDFTIDRPLRLRTNPAWTKVQSFDPGITEAGVEHLTIEFPNTPYNGHFTEEGYNAIAISNATHCWVRDVRIINSDSGIFMSGHFNTLDGVMMLSQRAPDRQGNVGHHALTATGSDGLVTNFRIDAPFVHDTTLSGGSVGNVWSNGSGFDLAMDHHRWGPYQNLFTNLDMGRGTRYFKSGGGGERGRHAGRGGTFWNLRAEAPAKMPNAEFGPAGLFFVGVQGLSAESAPDGWYVEDADMSAVPNLHEAQRAQRLGR